MRKPVAPPDNETGRVTIAVATPARTLRPRSAKERNAEIPKSGSCREIAPSDADGATVLASGVGSTTAPPVGVIDAPRRTSSSLGLGALGPMLMFSGREARMSAAASAPGSHSADNNYASPCNPMDQRSDCPYGGNY